MKLKQPKGSWTSTKTCWRHATRTSPPPPQNSEHYRRSPALHSSRFRSCSTKWPKFKRTRRMLLDRLGNAWNRGGGGGGRVNIFVLMKSQCLHPLIWNRSVFFVPDPLVNPGVEKDQNKQQTMNISVFNLYLRSLFSLRHFHNDLFVLFSCQICLFVCPFLIFIWDRYSHWDIFIMICLSYSVVKFACLCVLSFFLFSSFTTDACGFGQQCKFIHSNEPHVFLTDRLLFC